MVYVVDYARIQYKPKLYKLQFLRTITSNYNQFVLRHVQTTLLAFLRTISKSQCHSTSSKILTIHSSSSSATESVAFQKRCFQPTDYSTRSFWQPMVKTNSRSVKIQLRKCRLRNPILIQHFTLENVSHIRAQPQSLKPPTK